MNNELIINVDKKDIEIALLEDKQLVELNKEKSNSQFSVGDIYIGKVKKIMPGLNAAFVDVGYERDAFLHYLDLGPQFRTLKEWLQLSINRKTPMPKLSNYKLKPDIDKNGKITDVISAGDYIPVQIAKEPISTKGPRISSEISLAGRNLVLMPFSDKVSVSQKVKSAEERNRLKRLMLSIKPKNYGVIVRTVAQNKRVAQLDAELRELIERWETSFKALGSITPPQLLIGEINRTSAILRDILSPTFNTIWVNNISVQQEIKDYLANIAPEKEKIVKLYTGAAPIFEQMGIDKQIKTLFGKTVTIKSGAYLIIQHTEALHVIDVNSGNRASKGATQEVNALEVNLMAAEEIARQLRLRDMGGIIVVDFIDMQSNENKQKLFERMKEMMANDRTKHNILPLTKFGLMQITRQRVRPEMLIESNEKCPVCKGSGEISPSILLIDEIENNISYLLNKMPASGTVTLQVHPFINAYLNQGIYSILWKWRIKYKKFIRIKAVNSMPFLNYKFYNFEGDEIIL
ncbi:MAG TPA: ribonuclease E/G [Bacteroidales bacterium]|nr:ribonuclease E/G [Bacteroidales bacterium]